MSKVSLLRTAWIALVIHGVSVITGIASAFTWRLEISGVLISICGAFCILSAIFAAFQLSLERRDRIETGDERDRELMLKASHKALLYGKTLALIITLVFLLTQFKHFDSGLKGVVLGALMLCLSLAYLPTVLQQFLFITYEKYDEGEYFE